MAVNHQHPVTRPGLGHDIPILDPESINEGIPIHEIIVPTRRDFRPFLAEPRRRIRVLPVQIGDVGNKSALAEHEAAPADIVNPWTGLGSPGVEPVEPLAIRTKAETGLEFFRGLMDGCVDHKPVESLGHSRISDRLELAGMALVCPPSIPFPGTAVGCKGFSCADILAIDMGHRRRFTNVRLHVRHRGIYSSPEPHPECTLGYIGSPFNHHSVPGESTPLLMGFAVALDAMGMEYPGRQVVVILGEQLP